MPPDKPVPLQPYYLPQPRGVSYYVELIARYSDRPFAERYIDLPRDLMGYTYQQGKPSWEVRYATQ